MTLEREPAPGAPCPRHNEVLALLKSGGHDGPLVRHVRACIDCSDLAAVLEYLATMTMRSPSATAADATAIWQRSRVPTQLQLMRSVSRPSRVAESVAATIAVCWV